MKQSIVIQTYKGSPWLQGCLDSIPGNLPVMVLRDGHYECAAFRAIMEKTTLDRWLFLQDSTKIKDPSWLYEHWDKDASIGLIGEPSVYGSYLGWWRRSILEQCHIPTVSDKIGAVLAEMSLPQEYTAKDPEAYTLWPELTVYNAVDEIMFTGTPHERLTKRYENQFFCKWKSSFCGGSSQTAQERDDRIRALYP